MTTPLPSPPPSAPFHIRPFLPSDLPQVKRLFQSAQEEYGDSTAYCNYAFKADLADVPANYLHALHSTFLCAISSPSTSASPLDEEVIGIIGLRPMSVADPEYYAECLHAPPRPLPFDPTRTLEFNRVAVCPSARRLGVARALLDDCLRLARGWGQQAVHLSTLATMPPAVSFYRACGFTQYRIDRVNWVEDPRIGTEEMRRVQRERGDREEDRTRRFIDASEVPLDPAVISEQRSRGIYYQTHLYLRLDQ